MANLTLRIINRENTVICEASKENFVNLVFDAEYNEGDYIVVSSSEYPIYLNVQVDEVIGESFMYFTDDLCYRIPFGAMKLNRSPKSFEGNRHYIYAREATQQEIECYRNLALNPNDQHFDVPVYPHASANTETRGEAVFLAQNAIDGCFANSFHGEWPYTSWGINRQSNAEITVDFGRFVTVDKILLTLRADFPHDSWWEQVSLNFSDGSCLDCKLIKTDTAQEIRFPAKNIKWVRMNNLIKANDPSPFPALTQIEIFGVNNTGDIN